MNYFPFHLGDYAAHTGHLEPMEDLAYRRMLDQYYLREGPMPADTQAVAKLIRMRPFHDVVVDVLNEFFALTPEGWRHSRCDEEINRMQAKQDASVEREEHEKTRMQKHRERRSAMFAQLADVGVYPAYNTKTGELERLISVHCGATVTPPVTPSVTPVSPIEVTQPVTAQVTDVTETPSPLIQPATAIPTPTPTPTPTPISIPLSSAAKLPTCPQAEIIRLYHDILPEMPEVRVLDSKPRQAAMRKVWQWVLTSQRSDGERRATDAESALAWFRAYFERARNNDFLMGRASRTGEHANWRCDFDFLLTDKGMKHVIEKTLETA